MVNIAMLIVEDAISDDEIHTLRAWVDQHPKTKYVNWIEDGKLIDHRWNLNLQHPDLAFITELVRRHFDTWTRLWSAYQIQTNPHGIHIDEYGNDSWPDIRCWTYVLALDTIPEFKTIVWQEEFHNGRTLSDWIQQQWVPNRHHMHRSDISKQQDLEHTYDPHNEDYLADYLTPEGIFSYQKGSAVLFDGNKLHCTSNWKKYPQFDHRELLQIHVMSTQPRISI